MGFLVQSPLTTKPPAPAVVPAPSTRTVDKSK